MSRETIWDTLGRYVLFAIDTLPALVLLGPAVLFSLYACLTGSCNVFYAIYAFVIGPVLLYKLWRSTPLLFKEVE